jgi:hypothetical protein
MKIIIIIFCVCILALSYVSFSQEREIADLTHEYNILDSKYQTIYLKLTSGETNIFKPVKSIKHITREISLMEKKINN